MRPLTCRWRVGEIPKFVQPFNSACRLLPGPPRPPAPRRLLGSGLFEIVRKQHRAALSKVAVVAGDVSQPDLGLGPEDLGSVARNVDVVIHCAARWAPERGRVGTFKQGGWDAAGRDAAVQLGQQVCIV